MTFTLFKYHKANDHLYELLINQTLYCCAGNKLNDPHEGLYAISDTLKRRLISERLPNIKEKMREMGAPIPNSDDQLINTALTNMTDKDYYDILHHSEESLYLNVCSFSEDYLSELMWAHYSDNFRGVCIEFDFSKETQIQGIVSKVKYTNDLPTIESLSFDDLKAVYTVKREAWSYEKEWRIITFELDKIRFKPEHLKMVIFGVRTPTVKIESIKKLCQNQDFKHVQFKKLNLNIR